MKSEQEIRKEISVLRKLLDDSVNKRQYDTADKCELAIKNLEWVLE